MVEYRIEIRIVEVVKGPPEDVIAGWFYKDAKGPCAPREGESVKVAGHLTSKVRVVKHDPITQSVTVELQPARIGSFDEMSKDMKRLGYTR